MSFLAGVPCSATLRTSPPAYFLFRPSAFVTKGHSPTPGNSLPS